MTDATKLVDPAVDAINATEEAAPLIKQLDVHVALLNLAVAQNDKQLVHRVLHHLGRFGASIDKATLAEYAQKYACNGKRPACACH